MAAWSAEISCSIAAEARPAFALASACLIALLTAGEIPRIGPTAGTGTCAVAGRGFESVLISPSSDPVVALAFAPLTVSAKSQLRRPRAKGRIAFSLATN